MCAKKQTNEIRNRAGEAAASDQPKAPMPVVLVRPAGCPSCKSTNRAPFRDGPVAQMETAVEIEGVTYNRQTWRNTKCLDCGQRYRVIEYGFSPEM